MNILTAAMSKSFCFFLSHFKGNDDALSYMKMLALFPQKCADTFYDIMTVMFIL